MSIIYVGNSTWYVRDVNGKTIAICRSLTLAQSFIRPSTSLAAATLAIGAL